MFFEKHYIKVTIFIAVVCTKLSQNSHLKTMYSNIFNLWWDLTMKNSIYIISYINQHLWDMCLHWPELICANIYDENTMYLYTINIINSQNSPFILRGYSKSTPTTRTLSARRALHILIYVQWEIYGVNRTRRWI